MIDKSASLLQRLASRIWVLSVAFANLGVVTVLAGIVLRPLSPDGLGTTQNVLGRLVPVFSHRQKAINQEPACPRLHVPPVSVHQTCVANTMPAQALDRAVAAPVYDMDKARVAGAATPSRQS